MVVRQQTLGHGHRQVRHARGLYQRANVGICLGIGSALTEQNEWALGILEQRESALDRLGRGKLAGRCIYHLDQRGLPGSSVHGLPEQLGWQIQVNPTRAT